MMSDVSLGCIAVQGVHLHLQHRLDSASPFGAHGPVEWRAVWHGGSEAGGAAFGSARASSE